MKRFIAAVLILSLTVIVSVSVYFLVCHRIDDITDFMKSDRDATVKSMKIDPERTALSVNEWNKNEKLLVSLLTHHELEEVEIGIRCLENYSEQNLVEEYIETLNECINHLEHIKETELPDIKNIF